MVDVLYEQGRRLRDMRAQRQEETHFQAKEVLESSRVSKIDEAQGGQVSAHSEAVLWSDLFLGTIYAATRKTFTCKYSQVCTGIRHPAYAFEVRMGHAAATGNPCLLSNSIGRFHSSHCLKASFDEMTASLSRSKGCHCLT